jgi:hypothetical protein
MPSGASIDNRDDAEGSLRALRVPSVVWTRSGGNRRRGVSRVLNVSKTLSRKKCVKDWHQSH